MIAFADNTGTIIAGVAASSPDVLQTLTRIPDGTTAYYVDDQQYPNVWTDMGEWQIQNGTPVNVPFTAAQQLSNAQTARCAYIDTQYEQAMLAGFTSTADGTSRTYGGDPTTLDEINMLRGVILANNYPSGGMLVLDSAGNHINMTQTQAQQLCNDAQTFYVNNRNNRLDKRQQIMAATTVTDVNAITW